MSAAAILMSLSLIGGVPHNSTAYCLTSRMADGTFPRKRSLAARPNYPLGSKVWVEPAVFYIHRWVVRDRTDDKTEADFWTPSCRRAILYGRHVVKIRRGWKR